MFHDVSSGEGSLRWNKRTLVSKDVSKPKIHMLSLKAPELVGLRLKILLTPSIGRLPYRGIWKLGAGDLLIEFRRSSRRVSRI